MMGNIQKAVSVKGDMIQNSIIIKYSIYDEIKNLLEKKDLVGVAKLLDYQKNIASTYHPNYPMYSTDFKTFQGKFIPYSKPNTREALELMPQSLKGKFRVSRKYSDFSSFEEILEFSKNTQTDIEIDMIEIKKMLGDVEDPYQFETEGLLNNENVKWAIKAQEFPPSTPYKITIGNSEKIFEYIMLRAKSFYDNKIVLSNEEQNFGIYFEISFDINKQLMNLNIRVKEYNNLKVQLDFLQTVKLALNKEWLSIYSLIYDKELARGKLDSFDYSSGFESIHDEIAFIENLILIENKFNKSIIIPKIISENDLYYIKYLAQAIKTGHYIESLDSCLMSITVLDETLKNRNMLKDELKDLCHTLSPEVYIFEEVFRLKSITRTYKSLKINNYDRIIQKLEVADVGDELKIELIPYNNNTFIDYFEFF